MENIAALADDPAVGWLDGEGNFPACRCGAGYLDPVRRYKKCENNKCVEKEDFGGALNVNYCTNCDD